MRKKGPLLFLCVVTDIFLAKIQYSSQILLVIFNRLIYADVRYWRSYDQGSAATDYWFFTDIFLIYRINTLVVISSFSIKSDGRID